MRAASTALINFLNAARSNPDAPIVFVDLYLFTLSNGVQLAYSSADFPVAFAGVTYLANGPQIQGLKYTCKVGLEVDRQQITIAAKPTDLVNGAPILFMLRDGAFDGATFVRTRVFFTAPPALGGTLVDGVSLFHGRVSTVDQVGRTTAKVTIASDLVVLDYDMPRNLYSLTCLHTLYDSGCGLTAASYAASGTVAAASTTSLINWSGALAAHAQGKIVFTSGLNEGVSATVRAAAAGTSIALMYPLPNAPATGDAFTVYQGCDHTESTCSSRFSNLARFRGFPFVPPPDLAY